ncbi:hypothetical protein [Streptomyces megasporus]|uniref:hypothetical protein n=1 Tax=Streptomyces megasporus TaxID=44060 RepID=UPI0004E171DD|nr:hypothetical protein [Streptomyces megasporus]
MGYTHYYAYAPRTAVFRTAWPQMVVDTRRILDTVRSGAVSLAGPFGSEEPEVTERIIHFNGRRPYHYESFVLDPEPPDPAVDPYGAQRYAEQGFAWSFCKTARQPYDIAVSAVLLRCHMLAPAAFVIGSDGYWNDEWRTARQVVEALFDTVPDVSPFQDTTAGPELRAPCPSEVPGAGG